MSRKQKTVKKHNCPFCKPWDFGKKLVSKVTRKSTLLVVASTAAAVAFWKVVRG